MMREDTVTGLVIVAIILGVLLTVVVGVTWGTVNKTNAIARMVEAGADPIEAGCALGKMATCDVIGRQK